MLKNLNTKTHAIKSRAQLAKKSGLDVTVKEMLPLKSPNEISWITMPGTRWRSIRLPVRPKPKIGLTAQIQETLHWQPNSRARETIKL